MAEGLNWNFVQFETAEAMQPLIRSAADTSRFLICLDEDMEVSFLFPKRPHT